MEQSQERSELSTPPQQDQASSAGINAPVTAEGEAKVIATETEEDTPASIEDGAEVPSGREEEGGGSEKEEEGRREEGGGSEEEERESGEEEGRSGEELVESGGVETGGDQVASER